MNDKTYWTAYKKYKSQSHKIKSACYILLNRYENRRATRNIALAIAKRVLLSTIVNIIPVAILILIDNYLRPLLTIAINLELSSALIMAGIGVAGIFLGLYCANVTSIYTAKYANAPDSIGGLFENDIISNSSISHISNYILFSVLLVFSNIIGYEYGIIRITVFLFFTIWLIISFGLLGNKRHRLSDTYGIADSLYRNIVRMVKKATINGTFYDDINFQIHYQKVCSKYIDSLNDIAKYNIENSSNHADAMLKFAIENYGILGMYWQKKAQIPFSSKWYRDKLEYAKWHFASDHEIKLAVETGTTLQPKTIQDKYWFEDSIFAVNRLILDVLVASKDWQNLSLYCSGIDNLAEEAVVGGCAKYFLKHVGVVVKQLMQLYVAELGRENKKTDNNSMLGLIDAISLIFISTVLAINKFLPAIDWNKYIADMLIVKKYEAINTDNNAFANNRRTEKLYHGIYAEYIIERKRITSDWFIEQTLAQSVFEYVEELTQTLDDINNDMLFEIGKQLYENKAYFESMMIFSRMSELKFKTSLSLDVLNSLIPFLQSKHFEKTYIWPDSTFESLKMKIEQTSRKLPFYWVKCSGHFSVAHWEDNSNYPDILGQCYNYLCDYLIQALEAFDYEAFASNYPNLLGIMLLYQEFTRKDVIGIKEIYKQDSVLNLLVKPMIEYSTISGYAYLWGELVAPKWKELILASLEKDVRVRGEQAKEFYIRWVDLCKYEGHMRPGIYNRDLIQTSWKIRIEQTIRNSELLEYDNTTPYGLFGIKTDNKIIKSFFGHSPDLMLNAGAHEIYLILCINQYLPLEKRYSSQWEWEKALNEEDE